MSCHDSLDPAQHAKRAAVEAVAAVVDNHLRHEAVEPTVRDDPDAPVLLHVDGPGKSQFLDALEQRMDPFAPVRSRYPVVHASGPAPWSAIRFDAWQHQRLAPPWWWLINALDRQLQLRHR